jgi:adenine phosphoribosyltransferase
MQLLKTNIREVPNFPIAGVLFKDISPIFLNPGLIRSCEAALTAPWKEMGITKVVGIDSRGFLFGPQISCGLGAGFTLARKKGKLPPETIGITYDLEYGTASMEIVKGAIVAGDKVLIHDDLLATGGTALAAAKLAEMAGATVVGFSFLVNLTFLAGEKRLHSISENIHSLVNY